MRIRPAPGRRLGRLLRGALTTILLLGCVAGCKSGKQELTAVRLITSWPDTMMVSQLEFTITDPAGKVLVQTDRRPAQASDTPLDSPSDVVIYFRDELGGSDVRCDIRGLLAGQPVGTASVSPHLIAQTTVVAQVQLGAKANGETCATGSECASTLCADGVCCEAKCGVCQACDVPGKAGTCADVPAGTRNPGCADQGAQTCGFDGKCDGAGHCRQYPAGTQCGAGMCSGSSIISASACDGKGKCMPGPTTICAPFNCDPNNGNPRCFSRCTTGMDCIPGRDCVMNSCGKKQQGAACMDGAECTTGFCADGVCCDSKCDGACVACNQPGAMGTCKMVTPGTADPHKVCKDQGAASCGQTGNCDSKGACERYPMGTMCQPPSCMSATVALVPGRCDATGKCQAGGMLACAPFVCRNTSCVATCAKNDDCVAPNTCDLTMKSCGKKGQGQPCMQGTECLSNFCVDGVCCESACAGPCRSCALGTVPGKCTMAAAGNPDPRGSCMDKGASSCATDGTCDGGGNCRKYPVGTVCGNQSCDQATSAMTLPPTCDEQGRCTAMPAVSCSPYRCNTSSCFTACATDANCGAPNVCTNGNCGKAGTGQPCTTTANCAPPLTCINSTCLQKPNGYACTGNDQCQSKLCTEGVCCDMADCGRCRSCKVNNFVGFCHAVPAGSPDPKNMCPADAASTCGRDGTCNGAGNCRLYQAGTECVPAACNFSGDRTNPRTCDGAGTCQGNGTTNCDPFVCNPSTHDCFTSCNDKSQCAGNRRCKDNTCR